MYTTSNEYKNANLEAHRQFESRITIGNRIITNEEVVSINLQQSIQQEATFTIGNTISSVLNLTFLHNDVETSDRDNVNLEIGLLVNSAYEYIPLGIFNIDNLNSNDTTTSIVAYDNMIKFDIPYDEKNSKPTVYNVINRLIELTGIEFAGTLSNYTNYNLISLNGYTCREVLGFVAGVLGCNVIIDRQGKFKFIDTIKTSSITITNENYFNYAKQSRLYKISKIVNEIDEINIEKGTLTDDTVCLYMSNPFVNDDILQQLYTKLNGFNFIPFELNWNGDLSLDPGDSIEIIDKKGTSLIQPILSQSFTYTGGLSSTIQAQGDTKLANTYTTRSKEEAELDRTQDDLNETIEVLNATNAVITNLKTSKLEAKDLTAINADIENLKVNKASITDLDATNANIQSLKANEIAANTANIGKLNVSVANIDKALINKLEAKDLTVINADINNLKTDKANITDLNVTNINVSNLQANKANVSELNSVKAQIGTLNAGEVIADKLHANTADINNLTANKANITDLNATNGNILNLTSQVADIETLVNGNLTSNNIQSLILTSDKVTVANGFIKNAMIENLDVSKINAGDISTSKFRIVSDNGGNLLIKDNTIQIKDNTRTRVQIGKDASNDYNMYVWDSSGKLMFDATGLKSDGIKSKIIRDDMVSDNANISGSKLDINSVVTSINNGTNTIKGTKVKLDEQNQTLEVAFNNMNTTVNNQGSTISSHTTQLSTQAGQITTLISDSTITEDGQSKKLKDAYSSLKQTVSGISSKVSSIESNLADNYITTTAMNSAISQSATSITNTVSSTYYNKNDVDGKVTTLNNSISTTTQTANKINWFVKSGTSSSDMVLTDQLYSVMANNLVLKGNKIEITGATTITGLVTANSNFKILADGSMEAVNGKFSGNINASSIAGGSITGTTISGGTIIGATIKNANNTFSVDTNGNIKGAQISGSRLAMQGTNVDGNEFFMQFQNGYIYGDETVGGELSRSFDLSPEMLEFRGAGGTATKNTKVSYGEVLIRGGDGVLTEIYGGFLRNNSISTASLYCSGTISGSINGNSSTATTLQTARTINGTSFNGSANITTANWGTARTITIGNTGKSVNGSANVSWSLSEMGALSSTGGTVTGALAVNSGVTSTGIRSTDELILACDGANIEYTGALSSRIRFRKSGDNYYFDPHANNTVRNGSQTFSWNVVYATNGVNTTSDRTLKENIKYINRENNCFKTEDMYNFMKNDYLLTQYNYIGDDIEDEKISAIAQDLLVNRDGSDNKLGQLIVNYKEVVEANKLGENPKLSINQAQLLNVTIGALQKAMDKIENLEERLSKYENVA